MSRTGFHLNADTLDAVYARWGDQLPERGALVNDPAYERVTTIVICRRHDAPAFDLSVGGLFNTAQDAATWFNWDRGVALFLIDLTDWPCTAIIELRALLEVGERLFNLDWIDAETPAAALFPSALFHQIVNERIAPPAASERRRIT